MRGPTVVNFCGRIVPIIIGTSILAGCQSPLGDERVGTDLRTAIDRAVADELQTMRARSRSSDSQTTTRITSDIEETLSERRDELDELSPAIDHMASIDLGTELLGGEQTVVWLDLETAINSAMDHSLRVRSARLLPAINHEDVLVAEAIFDYVLFANSNLARTDQPTTIPVINNVPLGSPFNQRDSWRFDTGVQRTMQSGGTVTLSSDFTRTQNNGPGVTLSPDPAYLAAVRLGLTQPLLRGFGSDVTRASIRLAENAEERSILDLEREVLDIIVQVESAYWDLLLSWRRVEVQQWLVTEGVRIRDVLNERRDFDTRLAQYADAVARVEQRRADVIRAERNVRRASDALKALLDSADVSIGSESVLRPNDDFFDRAVDYNLEQTIVTALENRPEIQQALLLVNDSDIGRTVADNALLPQLDLTAQVAWFGQDDNLGHSFEKVPDSEFIDYIVGLAFEYPLGNQAAEAGQRRSRLVRSQSLLVYRQSIKLVVLDVKGALRDVVTNYALIEATRSFRVAQAENLRALLVEEEMLAGLTPEFLNLKFQRQDTLADARVQELAALANFDTALAALSSAMGTSLTAHGISVTPVSTPDAADGLVLRSPASATDAPDS